MRKAFLLSAALAVAGAALPHGAMAQTTETQKKEERHHELACTAATVGGAVAELISGEQFAATDADGDGVVTWAELDAQTLRDFDAADQDGNGSLD
jgi:hypothetical protein